MLLQPVQTLVYPKLKFSSAVFLKLSRSAILKPFQSCLKKLSLTTFLMATQRTYWIVSMMSRPRLLCSQLLVPKVSKLLRPRVQVPKLIRREFTSVRLQTLFVRQFLHAALTSLMSGDNLATKIRYFLKKKQVDASLITTVYSSEKSRCKLLPLDTEQADNPNAFGNVENFRIRVIPVLGTMPAMFGQSMAAYVLTEIAGSPINPENVAKLGRDQRNKYYQRLQQREKDAGFDQKIAVDKDDMDFIYQEVWKARSSVSGIRCGGFDRMFMSRWRKERPLNPGNIVLLTTKELLLMDSQGIEAFGDDVVARIDARLASFGKWEEE
ncbi:hypothetical protein AC1031_014288 [Aphanomyces cochlioides]|nr:hypothetical protein AC1031_014288 [Aphanomyces cochlioides]